MLNVFDTYSRESQDLLHSMQESGFDHPTVVLASQKGRSAVATSMKFQFLIFGKFLVIIVAVK